MFYHRLDFSRRWRISSQHGASEAVIATNFLDSPHAVRQVYTSRSTKAVGASVHSRNIARLTSSICAPRLAGFYIISVLIRAFAAIFAYALTFLGGKAGIPAWSWIFVSPRVCAAHVHHVHWLTPCADRGRRDYRGFWHYCMVFLAWFS